MQVYVVDDDSDIRSIVASAVELLGHAPSEFANGQSVLDQCAEALPDLLVLDVMMPGMDGNAVCRAVKEIEGGELVPVIMLTARDSLKDKVSSLDGGADDYLTKPFHYQELIARMKALLRIRELHQKLQEKNQQLQLMQDKLVEQERQSAVGELAGTAAHELGQPLSAIILNCHLLSTVGPQDQKLKAIVQSIQDDAHKMDNLIQALQGAKANQTVTYHGSNKIISLKEKDSELEKLNNSED